ncbi:MAG: hypothetical protein KA715_00540 [Xanthomonadaceae bacterium]|nr:hypothetical protein [Xanthomonadaceae bacterium]
MKNIYLIAGLGLALRFVFAIFGEFSTDAEAVYLSALKFYQTGVLGVVGARVVYSGTSIPGSLLDLMTGIPLFISRGALWGFAFAGAAYSWISAWIIFKAYRTLDLKMSQDMLAAFVFLSPWPILFSDALNSSLMLLPATIWFYSATQIFSGVRSRKQYVLLGLSFVLGFQLHLSFVILGFGAFVLLLLDEKSMQKKTSNTNHSR